MARTPAQSADGPGLPVRYDLWGSLTPGPVASCPGTSLLPWASGQGHRLRLLREIRCKVLYICFICDPQTDFLSFNKSLFCKPSSRPHSLLAGSATRRRPAPIREVVSRDSKEVHGVSEQGLGLEWRSRGPQHGPWLFARSRTHQSFKAEVTAAVSNRFMKIRSNTEGKRAILILKAQS